MKTTILKHRFLYVFILLGLTLSFNGCSDDDDEPETQTFLEKYDGTKWTYRQSDGDVILLRFNNNTFNTIPYWIKEGDDDCYWYNGFEDSDFGPWNNMENLEDRLIIKYLSNDFSETFTFTIQGERIKFVDYWIEEGVSNEEIYFLDKTTLDLDNLNICN